MGRNERFENNLNENQGLTLLNFHYNGTEFSIRTTNHYYDKFQKRGISLDIVCGDIVALGKERLYNYAETGDDVAIIDVDNNITTIITFENTQIRIRTVIPKSNVWIKEGTRIFNLRNHEGGFKNELL